MPIKVLYIDCVGQFGGATRSLGEVITPLITKKSIKPYFLVPHGSSAKFYKKFTKNIYCCRGLTRFYNSRTSYYRGFRWLILFREFYNLIYTFTSVLHCLKKFKNIDLIHINEIHDLPTGLIAKYFLKIPLIVHLRNSQRDSTKSFRVRILHLILTNYVDQIIAIDQNTRSLLPKYFNIEIINNSYNPDKSTVPLIDRNKYPDKKLFVGFVGNILKSKGVLDLVKAFKIIKHKNLPIKLIVAGGMIRSSNVFRRCISKLIGIEEDILPEIEDYILKNDLSNYIDFIGHVKDIDGFYQSIDLIIFPSYFDSPGRPILEAAHFSKPSISCVSNPMDDTIIKNVTGLVIPEKKPKEIYNSIKYLYLNPDKLSQMGSEAKKLSGKNFDSNKNSNSLLKVYENLFIKKSPFERFKNRYNDFTLKVQQKRKIAHVCLSCNFYDQFGYQENKLVKKHLDSGHDVNVFTSTEMLTKHGSIKFVKPSSYISKDGCLVHRLPYAFDLHRKISTKIRAHKLLYKYLKSFSPDVIFFHGTCGWEVLTVRKYVLSHPKVELFIDSHEDHYNSATNFLSRIILHKLFYRSIIQYSLPYVKSVLCVSVETISFVRKIYKIPESKIEFFPLGADIICDQNYNSIRKKVRSELNISENEIVILQSGKQTSRKRLIQSLSSFSRVSDKRLKFLISGSISEEIFDEAMDLIKSDSRILFLGWCSSDKHEKLLCAADIYLQPGTQSVTMQQSMGARCALILDDVPSNRIYIKNNGWLLNNQQSLVKVLRECMTSDLNQMKQNSFELAKEFLDYNILSKFIF